MKRAAFLTCLKRAAFFTLRLSCLLCVIFVFFLILYIQSNFNGSNTFGTMKRCSRQGQVELMSVNHSARTRRHNGGISLSFSNMKVCCVFPLESPRRGDSNEYTQHTLLI